MNDKLNKVTKNIHSKLNKGSVSKGEWNNYINEVDKWVDTKTKTKQCGG